MTIKLGDNVKDRISGFQGVAVARHSYLNGCCRISVQPPVAKDGKLPETATFDEPQLEVVTASVATNGSTRTGGPEKYSDRRRY